MYTQISKSLLLLLLYCPMNLGYCFSAFLMTMLYSMECYIKRSLPEYNWRIKEENMWMEIKCYNIVCYWIAEAQEYISRE